MVTLGVLFKVNPGPSKLEGDTCEMDLLFTATEVTLFEPPQNSNTKYSIRLPTQCTNHQTPMQHHMYVFAHLNRNHCKMTLLRPPTLARHLFII